jgi:TolA-binding protein
MMSVTPLPPAPRNLRIPRGGGVRFIWVGLLLLALPGCATKGDVKAVTAAVDGLRVQSERTDSTLRALGVEIAALQDTLETEAGRGLDSRGGIARELRAIRDQLNRLEQLTGQIQAQVSRMDARVSSSLQNIRQLPTTVRPDSTRDLLREDSGGDAPAGDPDAVFEVAVRLFNSGSLATARAGFEQFLQMAPGHDEAPVAYFNLGDIAFQEDRLDDSVAAFLRVPELFPDSDIVPRALYRAGSVEHERGNDEAATRHLERVVNSYPDSGVAELARDLLEEIG